MTTTLSTDSSTGSSVSSSCGLHVQMEMHVVGVHLRTLLQQASATCLGYMFLTFFFFYGETGKHKMVFLIHFTELFIW